MIGAGWRAGPLYNGTFTDSGEESDPLLLLLLLLLELCTARLILLILHILCIIFWRSYFACLNMNHNCSVSLSYSLFSSLIFVVSVHYSDTLCYSHFSRKASVHFTGAGQRFFSFFAPQYHLLHINPFALFAPLSSSMLYTAHCSSCTIPRLRLLLHSCIAPCSKPLHYVALLHCSAPTMSFAHCS